MMTNRSKNLNLEKKTVTLTLNSISNIKLYPTTTDISSHGKIIL